MPGMARFCTACLLGTILCSTGCNLVPFSKYRQSQLHARQLHLRERRTQSELANAQQLNGSLTAEKARLQQQAAQLQQNLEVANSRIGNLNTEREQIKSRYVSLLNRSRNEPSPLSAETTRRFEQLQRDFPGFEFDPATGVSKFHSDILFGSGSDQIKTSGQRVLEEFAKIMNGGTAQRLNILVVGHTDDRLIKKQSTRQRHQNNMHLSTNRANSVVLNLRKYGLKESRMGAAGYGMHQPVAGNDTEAGRSQNRRVEIFVLAPDAVVAGWDPGSTLN